jgi:hypothetical protein
MYLPGRKLHWSVLAFLSAFLLILLLVGWMYLIPAASAMEHADATQRVWLRDTSRLLLAAILVTLGGILVICFRVGRYFLPGPTSTRTKTRYVDAWAEAGRRMEIPPEDKDDPPSSV